MRRNILNPQYSFNIGFTVTLSFTVLVFVGSALFKCLFHSICVDLNLLIILLESVSDRSRKQGSKINIIQQMNNIINAAVFSLKQYPQFCDVQLKEKF